MKRLVFLATMAIMLAGCGPPEREGWMSEDVYPIKVKVDGRAVNCIIYRDYKAGGISCDWEGWNK